jgi:hypothetical protein
MILALEAENNKTPVMKIKSWRRKNADTGKWEVIKEVSTNTFTNYRKS